MAKQPGRAADDQPGTPGCRSEVPSSGQSGSLCKHHLSAKLGGSIKIEGTIQEAPDGSEAFFCYVSLPSWAESDDEVEPHVGLTLATVNHLIGSLKDARLRYVRRLLGEVYEPEGVEIWLNSTSRQLGGARAIDLIEVGESERVVAAIRRLLDGAFS